MSAHQQVPGDQVAARDGSEGVEKKILASCQLSLTICLSLVVKSDKLPISISTSVGNVLLKYVLRNKCLFFSFTSSYCIYSFILSFCISLSRKQKLELSFLCHSLDCGATSHPQEDLIFPQSPPSVRGSFMEIVV